MESMSASRSPFEETRDEGEEDGSFATTGEAVIDDENEKKKIGMDEVTPEGVTYHVNTIELEIEKYVPAKNAVSTVVHSEAGRVILSTLACRPFLVPWLGPQGQNRQEVNTLQALL